jgi:hypothetical protein
LTPKALDALPTLPETSRTKGELPSVTVNLCLVRKVTTEAFWPGVGRYGWSVVEFRNLRKLLELELVIESKQFWNWF